MAHPPPNVTEAASPMASAGPIDDQTALQNQMAEIQRQQMLLKQQVRRFLA